MLINLTVWLKICCSIILLSLTSSRPKTSIRPWEAVPTSKVWNILKLYRLEVMRSWWPSTDTYAVKYSTNYKFFLQTLMEYARPDCKGHETLPRLVSSTHGAFDRRIYYPYIVRHHPQFLRYLSSSAASCTLLINGILQHLALTIEFSVPSCLQVDAKIKAISKCHSGFYVQVPLRYSGLWSCSSICS